MKLSFLSLALVFSFQSFAQRESSPYGQKQKIHIQPVEMTPRNSYKESQIIKSALRTLYQTGRYHILVGDNLSYKKIVIGLETLLIQSRRFREKYQITITWREQKKGKILKKITKTNIKEENYLSVLESMLGKLFIPDDFKAPPTIIIDKRKNKKKAKSKNIIFTKKRKTSKSGSFNSNVVVLTKNEIEQKRISPQEYFKERDKKRKQKTWGKLRKKPKQQVIIIPEEEIIPDEPKRIEPKPKPQPVIVLKPLPKPKPEPEPVPEPFKEPRKPFPLRAAFNIDYESLTSDDLLTNTGANIIRYGLELEPRIWTFNPDSMIVAGARLYTYSSRVIVRNTRKRLSDEWGVHLSYRHFLLNKRLELNGGVAREIRSWANLPVEFQGIQAGILRTTDIDLSASIKFPLFGREHGFGAQYLFPIIQEVKYSGLNLDDVSSSQWNIFYDFYLGEMTRIRAGYSTRVLQINDKKNPISGKSLQAESNVVFLKFILDFSL